MRLHLSLIENHELRVINIPIVWRPMSLPEIWSWETWKNGIAIQHVANGVKGAWMIIWSSQIHNDMGTG